MEIWKDIIEYEGLYQVSNLGRVKSIKPYPLSRKKEPRNRILLFAENNRGYLTICLCKNSSHKTILVHRLVASAFLPNTENFEQVNHIDGNKTNNVANNLEWCTRLQNMQHYHTITKHKRSNSKPSSLRITELPENIAFGGSLLAREYELSMIN